MKRMFALRWIHKSNTSSLFIQIPHTVLGAASTQIKRGSEKDVEENVAVISAAASLTAKLQSWKRPPATLAVSLSATPEPAR